MIVYDIANLIDNHLKMHYRCYGFNIHICQNQYHDPVQVMGQMQPVNQALVNYSYQLRIKFIQSFAPDEIPAHAGYINMRDPQDPFLKVLQKYLREWNMGRRHALTSHHYEMETDATLELGDERHAQKILTELKNASWNEFSKHFDAEIEEELKSK